MLAGLPEADAEAVLTQFKALSAQIKESGLTGALGADGEPGDKSPVETFNAAVLARQKDAKVDYNTAAAQIAAEQPELYAEVGRAWKGAK
jgi:hypothetical protein